MGVTITATKPLYTFDTGCGGFFNLRKNIAYCLDEEFGANYANLLHCHSQAEYKMNDREAEKIIARKHLDDNYSDVLDFLYASDTDGRVSYKTCKKIYDMIKNKDFGTKIFRYGAIAHNDYEEFKLFLLDCYSNRKYMRWH